VLIDTISFSTHTTGQFLLYVLSVRFPLPSVPWLKCLAQTVVSWMAVTVCRCLRF